MWLTVLLGTGPAPASGPPPVDVAAVAARLDDLTRRITGDADELRANYLVNYHRVEGGIKECMRARGQDYRMLPFVDFYRDFTDADVGFGDGRGSVLDSLTGRGRRGVLTELAFARLERGGVHRERVQPYLAGCREKFGDRSYSDTDPPHPAVHPLSDFPGLLDPGIAAVPPDYGTCMARRGHQVGPERLDFLFAPRYDRADAPADGERPGPAWTRGVAAAEAVLAADAECRRPAYEAAIRLVAARLDDWEAEHREQLAEIRAAWRLQVRKAAALDRPA